MSSEIRIRVLIVDDNPVVRRGLRLRLSHARDMDVIGEASNGTDAVTIARAEHADVVLMDLQMPRGNGVDATRALAGPGVENPVRVIVLTNHAAHAFVLEALDAGAVGYLLKTHDSREIPAAIRSVYRGEPLVSSRVAVSVIREMARQQDPAGANDASASVLSPAELQVVRHLCRGRTTNEEIAAALFVSVNTVRAQLASAMHKTGLANRTQLALWAVRHGLNTNRTPPPFPRRNSAAAPTIAHADSRGHSKEPPWT